MAVDRPADAVTAVEGEPGGPSGDQPGAGRGPRPLVFAMVTLIVAALVAAGFLAAESLEVRERQQNRAEALRVARQLTVNFITLDYRTFDRDLKRVRALTGGKLDQETKRAFDELREVVSANKMTSKGRVLDAGLVSADQDSARALVVADSTVTNVASEKPQARHYRFQLDLARKGSEWHVVDLQVVGGGPA